MTNKSIISAAFVLSIVLIGFVSTVNAASCVSLGANLRYGSSGSSDVVDLQQFLLDNNYLNDKPSGFYGKLTQAAVKKFQKDNGLPSTGIVAYLTRSKIGDLSCRSQAFNKSTVYIASNLSNVAVPVIVIATPTPTPTKQTSILPYTTFDFSGWKTQDGIATLMYPGLQLNSTTETTTALSSFPKGSDLTNYKLTVNAFVRRGTLILVARYKDNKNYLACNFYGKSINLVQILDGKQTTLANVYLDDSTYSSFFFNDLNVSMSVNGKNAGCTQIGGQDNVTTNRIDDSLMSGAPGVKIWYEAPGVANSLIRSVKVEAV